MRYKHSSVLLEDVVEILQPKPGRLFVDGTLGAGGHTAALLGSGAQVIGLDQDLEAIHHVARNLSDSSLPPLPQSPKLELLQTNFRELDRVLLKLGIKEIDGLLLDLGISSGQLDQSSRGFSFQIEGPLDMRMNQNQGFNGADWIANTDELEIAKVIHQYGEEPYRMAKQFAKSIVETRKTRPILSTKDLTALIERISPRGGRGIHPATKVFQAIRIAINDELAALQAVLSQSANFLRPHGRLVVISFHSLEDRVVKNFLRETSAEWLMRPEWSAPKRNPRFSFNLIERRPRTASEAEVQQNPRSRSAKLRWAERI